MPKVFIRNYVELRNQIDVDEIPHYPNTLYLLSKLQDYVNEYGIPDSWKVTIRIPYIYFSRQAGNQAVFEYVGQLEVVHFFTFLTVVP